MSPGPVNRIVIDSSVLVWSRELPKEASQRDRQWQLDAIDVMECIEIQGFHLALSKDLYGEIMDQLENTENAQRGLLVHASQWMTARMSSRHVEKNLYVPVENALQSEKGTFGSARRPEDPPICATMLKDAHLIESALSSDLTVISRDEDVLYCWIEYCHWNPSPAVLDAHRAIRSIVWADPRVHGHDDVIGWLMSGAPAREDWTLGGQLPGHHCRKFASSLCLLDHKSPGAKPGG